jgi:LysM repeat protein
MDRIGRGLGCLLVLSLLLSAVAPVWAQDAAVHVVQPGENLFRIALYYGTTVDAIQAANGMDSVYVYVGQRLTIPGGADVTPPEAPLTPPDPDADEPTPVPTPGSPALDARTYVVQPSDTLTGIAAKLRVSRWSLMMVNGLVVGNLLYAGQELIVPGMDAPVDSSETSTPEADADAGARATATPTADAAADPTEEASAPPSAPETYTIQRGDTLTQIAARFGTSVASISALNGIANPSSIYVGQTLRLKGSAPAPTGAGQLIVIDLSEQHLYAYQGDQLVYSFVASSGRAPTYTRTGEFRVQSKIPNAYGSTWNIWMPYWLGIYWAGSMENGIHALPETPGGQTLWAGYLGTPISFGCIVLGTYEARLLYEWAQIGTPVSIRY